MTLSFVLHNNFLSCVIHSSCVSCLSFCTSVHMAGAVQAYATCHCPYHKVTAHPHSSPLSSAKTGRYLLATWRHLETRWTWAFSHIGQNNSSIFYYPFIKYLAPSCNFLSSDNCLSFHFLILLFTYVLYLTPLTTTKNTQVLTSDLKML